ncbi:MAG: aminoacyl-histidine dipeptidase [candidate division KSB1 bacterium]|nr:aminoacyl-histidine dipeptidase [candidate division KSB1 bacterium]MDZ7335579.1 aminoacyl-histidine dipeptidase [candidate division KSB1 bacterium]MDZ7356451.1 aminoacyl-histidine dipeptidase [candidate division KSB1 bacterium]MDZ7401222.1 aminoacyl-histidine dipeptidase [candidate division KSB1 bacterium]
MKFEHAKTNEILKWFEQITKIPRCSKKEDQIRSWLLQWAKEHQFATKTDAVGNLVIKVPASPGYEQAPLTVLQGHMDMVCEKTPDSDHDFSKDPIKLIYDGDWLRADKTTLGADNGIAIAMAMTVAVSKDVPHPPLELLFTVDEETGLTGANALQPGFIEGKILINLDSEDEGVFTVGCAGGMNTTSTVPINFESIPTGYQAYKLTGSGMKGGHSGVNIKEERANAIKVVARVLDALKKVTDMRVAHIQGGRAHNAIPRDCEAVVFFPKNDWDKVQKEVTQQEQILKSEFKNTDPDLKITIEPNGAGKFNQVFTAKDTRKLIDFLLVMPHGVAAMSTDIPGLVETSNNLANITVENGAVKVLTSQRSSIVSRLHAHTNRIEAVTRLAGGEARSGDGYPPWPPRMDSPLLDRCRKLYRRMFGKDPVVEVIHAGLECGIIGDKNPGMDMISIGPDLKNPHSPDEKISIPAIGKVWDFLVELLKELKDAKPLA